MSQSKRWMWMRRRSLQRGREQKAALRQKGVTQYQEQVKEKQQLEQQLEQQTPLPPPWRGSFCSTF
jgi:hypothetical protein